MISVWKLDWSGGNDPDEKLEFNLSPGQDIQIRLDGTAIAYINEEICPGSTGIKGARGIHFMFCNELSSLRGPMLSTIDAFPTLVYIKEGK